jgi:ACS family tartrate transporter-like MFS transporter
VRLAALAPAVSGTLSFTPVFWTIAPSFLCAAPGGLTAISTMDILGGFLPPWFVGYLKVLTGDFRYGLGSVAVFGIAAGITLDVGSLRRDPAIETQSGTEPAVTSGGAE